MQVGLSSGPSMTHTSRLKCWRCIVMRSQCTRVHCVLCILPFTHHDNLQVV